MIHDDGVERGIEYGCYSPLFYWDNVLPFPSLSIYMIPDIFLSSWLESGWMLQCNLQFVVSSLKLIF